MGVIDFSLIDTDPGANSTFAPPTGWNGDYVQFMRGRWRADVALRQHAYFASSVIKSGGNVTIKGRYAKEAQDILESL